MTDYIKNLIKERPATDSYKYMLLERMKMDCNYYLGNGNRLKKASVGRGRKRAYREHEGAMEQLPRKRKAGMAYNGTNREL